MPAATSLTRSLCMLPPNVLTPASYTATIKSMAVHYDWDYTEWTPLELEALGCGAFVAVTQSNGPIQNRWDYGYLKFECVL